MYVVHAGLMTCLWSRPARLFSLTACSGFLFRSHSPVIERLVDQHGRQYYMDHSNHTISYQEREGIAPGADPSMQTRREMLDRR